MTEEEKEAIEQEFQYALDEILSLVKYETATAIVCKERSMILLFKKLLLKIDKQQKENTRLEEENKELRNFIHDNGMLYRRRDNQ